MSGWSIRQVGIGENRSELSWRRYLQNLGTWTGERCIIRPYGEVVFVLPSQVKATECERQPYGDQCIRWETAVQTAEGIDEEVMVIERKDVEVRGAVIEDGSYSLGPVVESGSGLKVQNGVVAGNGRVRCEFAYGWEGRLEGLMVSREIKVGGDHDRVEGIIPSAWKSPAVLLDYLVGKWKGGGVLVAAKGGSVKSVRSWVGFQVERRNVVQTSGVEIEGTRRRPVSIRAEGIIDGNVVMFAKDGVQTILAPGGVAVACPLYLGQAWAVETTWLVQPDEKRRVIRCYGPDGWLSTLFLKERRVG